MNKNDTIAQLGIDPKKPVFVTIDDNKEISKLLGVLISMDHPDVQVVQVESIAGKEINGAYKPGALDVLFHPDLQIAGVITDNNFPLVAGHGPKSTTRPNHPSSEDELAEASEGAAGIMLLRLIKGGSLNLESKKSKEELGSDPIVHDLMEKQEKGELKAFIKQRFADMPVMWNTGNYTQGKMHSIKEALEGNLLDAHSDTIRDESNADQPKQEFREYNVLTTEKPFNFEDMEKFFKEKMPERLTLLASQAGRKPEQTVGKKNIVIQSEPEQAQEPNRQ